MKAAALPLNFTEETPAKPVPLMVTVVLIGPEVGVKFVIAGNTMKFVALVAVPSGVVTAILPVVAPEGTLAMILVGLLMEKFAAMPLIVTEVAFWNLVP